MFFCGCDGLQILAVCDVDTNHRLGAKKIVDSGYGNNNCSAYNDFRDLLTRKDIDTVLIATPDHWHAVIAIAAAKAGKAICCEKPLALNVPQAEEMVKAMEEAGVPNFH